MELDTSKPATLIFETDTKCNGQCTFCQYPNMNRRDTMSWSNIIQLIYDYAPIVSEVCPFGMQEPMMEPRLTGILSSIKQFNRKVKTILYSNMTIYDEQVWRRIISHQSLDELNISFYGPTKKVFNKLQPNFNYHQVQKNIKKLVKLRRKLRWRKPNIMMRLIVTPETVGASKFTAKWREIVDQVGIGHFDAWCGKNKYNLEWEQRIWGPPAEKRTPCLRLWGNVLVHADGTVVPCCLDYDNSVPMGNIHYEKNVYNNKKFKAFRNMHIAGRQNEIDLCRDCSLWRYEHPAEWQKLWIKPVATVITPSMK